MENGKKIKFAPRPLALSPKDAAIALGCGLTNLYRMIGEGEINSVRLGGKRLISIAEIERVLGLKEGSAYALAS